MSRKWVWGLRVTGALLVAVTLFGACSKSPGLEQLADYPSASRWGELTFSVVSWNVHSGDDPNFPGELRQLIERERPGLLMAQEVTGQMVIPTGMGGEFAHSWRVPFTDRITGVATYSTLKPIRATDVPSTYREAIIATAKVALITEYEWTPTETLVVVNIHALNFDFGGVLLGSQLRDLERRVADHVGPMLMVGDFNAWSRGRLDVVLEVTSRLGLVDVTPTNAGGRTADSPLLAPFVLVGLDRSLPLDRMFCRGLELVESRYDPSYTGSDHSPLVARFRRK